MIDIHAALESVSARTEEPDARRMLAAIEERLAAMPGVETAGAMSHLPLLSAGPPDDFVIEGRPAPPAGTPAWNARYLMVTPRAFRALRIPLKRGRLNGESDVAGRPRTASSSATARSASASRSARITARSSG